MDQRQIERHLVSVGKSCFVNYFEYFNNPNYTHQELVDLLHRSEGYEKSACSTRVSKSRSIINEGKTIDALNIIIESTRLDSATILNAKRILKNLNQ